MKNKIIFVVSVIISLFLGVIGTLVVVYYIPTNPPQIEKEIKQVIISESDTIAPVVDMIYDSVVTVSNYNNKTLAAIGTGFIYRADDKYGYILTNNHVVSGASNVKVTNTKGEIFDAILLGSDQYADLAVLKVDKSFVIQVAKFGDSTALKIGDTVFAVGTPVSTNYAGSVTKGIVSGINREVTISLDNGSKFIMNVLQTNTAINPGNSGGPLVNMSGEVVGINTLKLVEEHIEGMGFSIPIEMASSVIERLEKGEKIERPFLGVSMLDANNSYGLYRNQIVLNKTYTTGVVLVEIEKNSVASKYGLKANDVILKIDNVEVKDSVYFRYLLYKYSIGDTINITYERNGKEETVKIKLENAM